MGRGHRIPIPRTWESRLALALLLATLVAACVNDGFPWVMPRAFLATGAVLLLLLGAWLAWRGSVRLAAAAVLSAAVAVAPPLRSGRTSSKTPNGVDGMTLGQLNVHEANDRFPEVVAAALASHADVLSVQEVDGRWWKALETGLGQAYPWRIHGSGERNYGIALFSRLPLENAEVVDLDGLPAVRAVVQVNEARVVVWAVHLRSPESATDLAQRNRQWHSLATLVQAEHGPLCLVGDLNTVPWDEGYEGFKQRTGMEGGGQDLIPTWPALAGSALIPLDHILASGGCSVEQGRTFGIPGSDHLGLLARIALPN
jgi:endonuclease/exonuclease/phosphatase (EEP) superfamily protein YafD